MNLDDAVYPDSRDKPHLRVETKPDFKLLEVPKPYLINKNQIECVIGEWNKDKTEYGARIFFASGNSVWCGTTAAAEVIYELGGEEADDKFRHARERESKK